MTSGKIFMVKAGHIHDAELAFARRPRQYFQLHINLCVVVLW